MATEETKPTPMQTLPSLADQYELTREIATLYKVPPSELVKTIKAQCFPNGAASDAQLMMFLTVCRERRLNPFLKEVYAFMQGGKMQIGIEVDGWIRKAQEHPQYDGCEYIDDYRGDKIFSVTCKLYRKDWKRPYQYTALFSEWNVQSNAVWVSKPRHMLAIKAFNQAVRFGLGLTGVSDADDIRATIDGAEIVDTSTGEVLNANGATPDAIDTTATHVEENQDSGDGPHSADLPPRAESAGAATVVATPPASDASGTSGEPDKKKRGRPRSTVPAEAAAGSPGAEREAVPPHGSASENGFVARKKLQTLAASLPANRIVILCGQFGVAKLDDLNDEQCAAAVARLERRK